MKKLILNFGKLLSNNQKIVSFCKLIVMYNSNDCNSDFYTNGELTLLKSVANNSKIILDIGCNIGEYSKEVLLMNYKEKLVVIDALDSNIDLTNKLLTPINKNNASIIYQASALGEKEILSNFFVNDDENLSGHNSFYDMKGIGYNESTHNVTLEIKRLDVILTQLNIDNVDFMKVDVEGYEMNVLKGADSFLKNGNIKILQLEFGHAARAGKF